MTSHEIAELTSLGLTPQTIISAAAVVVMWLPAAIRAFNTHPGQRNDRQWFLIGVSFGFVGQLLDNGYWSLPWSASFIDHPAQTELFANGVYFNIVFRQSIGIYAAYCHLKAAEISGGGRRFVNKLFMWANVIAALYLLLLLWMKGALG